MKSAKAQSDWTRNQFARNRVTELSKSTACETTTVESYIKCADPYAVREQGVEATDLCAVQPSYRLSALVKKVVWSGRPSGRGDN